MCDDSLFLSLSTTHAVHSRKHPKSSSSHKLCVAGPHRSTESDILENLHLFICLQKCPLWRPKSPFACDYKALTHTKINKKNWCSEKDPHSCSRHLRLCWKTWTESAVQTEVRRSVHISVARRERSERCPGCQRNESDRCPVLADDLTA